MSESSSWLREWGVLAVAAVVALPLFTPRLYGADEIKYVTHLRSWVFDGDVDYANDYQLLIDRNPVANDWLRSLRDTETATGRRLNDAPIGSAILWAPFYLAADVGVRAARAVGAEVPRDGFGRPYAWAVSLGSLFWGMLGLALTYRLCRDVYPVWPSQRAVLGVWFATAAVFYLYITPPMAHANSLFAVALFLWLWARGRGAPRSPRQWALLAAATGLMVLVRELNWLLLLPLVVDEGWSLLGELRRDGVVAVRPRLRGYALFAAVVALVVAPQFAMYRALHGTFSPTPFVVDKFSYPVFTLDVLFSGFHGLFSWTPITLIATAGLWLLARRKPVMAAGLAVAFTAQVLVIGSYASWWGGASFGARRFINFTPMFALGLAAVFDAVPRARRNWANAALVLAILWNFGLALQYATGMIPRDQPVTMMTIVRNQVTEVPRRGAAIAWQFLTDRWSLVENRPDSGR